VEGLVHISELATHHVENPREIVQQGETVRAKIIEMDAERRRLSLSLKRVEDGEAARPGIGESAAPDLGLSEEVFAEQPPSAEAAEPEPAPEAEAEGAEPQAEGEPSEESGETPVVQGGPTDTAGAAAQEEAAEGEAAPEGEASAEPDDDADR
jgi:small subunit ribosomal protein S1